MPHVRRLLAPLLLLAPVAFSAAEAPLESTSHEEAVSRARPIGREKTRRRSTVTRCSFPGDLRTI